MAQSIIRREYKFGRHWSDDFQKVSLEVSPEKALEQHRQGEGYTVLILENEKPRYAVVVGPGLRGVRFLDETCRTTLSLQFDEIEDGRVFLTRATPRREGIPHKPTGIVIGEGKSFHCSPDGKVIIYKQLVRGPR